jgi:DNA-binding NarL/FixJ family response regulator
LIDSPAGMIDVALVEDNATVRQGLAALIGGTPGYRCVGAFRTCEALLKEIVEIRPMVLLMDIGLPGLSGIEGVRRAKELLPELNVVMLTVYEDHDPVVEALCAGACGYLVKNTPPARLLEAISEARQGGSPMSSHIARQVVNMFRQVAPQRRDEENLLTRRERDVLNGLAGGNTYQTLAKSLGLGTDTVRFHIRNIYRKLHAHSQSEAVAKALRKGLL